MIPALDASKISKGFTKQDYGVIWITALSKTVVSNHVPWRAESMQVFTPTNHYTS